MNVAIIGCGTMGTLHAHAAAAAGLRIAACADSVQSRAKALARQFDARATTQCAAALRGSDIDAVVVATPTPTHARYAIKAAHAGKHVFCETPLARTVVDCREAVDAAKRARVKLFAPHPAQYAPPFIALHDQAEAGKIGCTGFIRIHRGRPWPKGARNWYRDARRSGGVVFNDLIHDFDWLSSRFGPVKRIFCQTLPGAKRGRLDCALATLTLESGAIAQVIGSWAHSENDWVRVELCGDAGIAQYDSEDPVLSVTTRGDAPEKSSADAVTTSVLRSQWDEFIASTNGTKPHASPTDAVAAVRIAAAALESARTGKSVRL